MKIAGLGNAGLGNAGLAALGLVTLLGIGPTGAQAQDSAAPGTEAMRLFRIPLKNATTAFIVGKLSHVYYWTRPAGPGASNSNGSSFKGGFSGGGFGGGFSGNSNGQPFGGNPFEGGGFGPPPGEDRTTYLKPSALRLDGVRFLIDNERDNSLLLEATPEGFNMLRNIVSALDVPLTARAKHVAAKIAP